MPSFDFVCPKCRCTFDEILTIEKRDSEVLCPDCGATAKRQISMPAMVMGDTHSWGDENKGKGRRISQLDYGPRKPYYAKSQQAAIDEAHRRGLRAEKTR